MIIPGLQPVRPRADGRSARTSAAGVRYPVERKDRSVIAVTCPNGEHFSFDPATISRIETVPDTVVHLLDGTHYVVRVELDVLLRSIRDHQAALVMSSKQLTRTRSEVSPAHPSLFGRDLVPAARSVSD